MNLIKQCLGLTNNANECDINADDLIKYMRMDNLITNDFDVHNALRVLITYDASPNMILTILKIKKINAFIKHDGICYFNFTVRAKRFKIADTMLACDNTPRFIKESSYYSTNLDDKYEKISRVTKIYNMMRWNIMCCYDQNCFLLKYMPTSIQRKVYIYLIMAKKHKYMSKYINKRIINQIISLEIKKFIIL